MNSNPVTVHVFRRRFCVLMLAIPALGLVATAYGYWPGVMIEDARWQYQQAINGAYEDWHPPVMAWVWHQFIAIYRGPAPMLVLQLVLYWTGIALIAWSAYRRGRPGLAVALASVGWLPIPLALTGTILKDCLMAGALGNALGLLLLRGMVVRRWVWWCVSGAVVLLLLFAAALRFNAFLACMPLAMALVPRRLVCTRLRFAATAAFATMTLLMVTPILGFLLKPEKMDPQLSLILFDLGGITEHSGVSVFPDMQVSRPVAVNHACYDPIEWDSYSAWAQQPCPLGFDPFRKTVAAQQINPTRLWLGSILNHPLAYAEHRLVHFNISTRFVVADRSWPPAWTDSVANPWGYHVRPNPVLATINASAVASGLTPFGWPICFIALALASLTIGYSAALTSEVLAVSASAFLYGAGYIVFSVATGMRYHMWTMTGAALAAVLVIGEMTSRRWVDRSSVALLAVGIITFPSVIGMLAPTWLS